MDGVAALAVTSANALVHALAALVERLQGPLAACRRPAHGQGRCKPRLPCGKGRPRHRRGTCGRAGHGLPPGSRVIYLCGRLRKPEFEAQLGAAGVAVELVETYDTRRVPPAATAAHARSIGPVDAVLVDSSEAAASLEALTREAGLAELFCADAFVAYRHALPRRWPAFIRLELASLPQWRVSLPCSKRKADPAAMRPFSRRAGVIVIGRLRHASRDVAAGRPGIRE